MMRRRTLLRYYILIYVLFLYLFNCLTTSWKRLNIGQGLGRRTEDRRQGLRDD